MRRVLRKASWALAAAGGIGWAAPVFAQEPISILGPSGHVVQTSSMSDAQGHEEEMKVALAFLADPMLFSFELGTHLDGEYMEVRGYVPNEIVRDRAMQVAKEHTSLVVFDKLKVQPNITAHSSVDRPENIQKTAQALLADTFPQHGAKIEVKCDTHGHVTVCGQIGSVEDRLAVSRKLRQVPGCSCVVNELTVPGAVVKTHPSEPDVKTHPAEPVNDLIFPDKATVPAKPAVRKIDLPPTPVPARTVVAPSIPSSFETPHLTPVPSPKPPVVLTPSVDVAPPVVKPEPHPKAPSSSIDLDRSYGGSTALPPVAPPVSPKPAAVPSIDKDGPYTSGPKGTTIPDLPPVKVEPPKMSVPSIDKDHPYKSGSNVPDLPAPPPVKPPSPPPIDLPDITPSKATVPPQTKIAPPVVVQPKIITANTTTPQVITGSATQAKGLDLDRQPRGAGEESYVVEGTITFADDPPPVPKPTWSSTKPSSTPVKPAEGTMKLPPPLPPSRPASAPVVSPVKVTTPKTVMSPAAILTERVQTICGPGCKVTVLMLDEHRINLTVSSDRNEAEARRLMEQIKAITKSPEFRGIDIDGDVLWRERRSP